MGLDKKVPKESKIGQLRCLVTICGNQQYYRNYLRIICKYNSPYLVNFEIYINWYFALWIRFLA